MPVWAYWMAFVLAALVSVGAAKRLDDLERRRWRALRAGDDGGPPAT